MRVEEHQWTPAGGWGGSGLPTGGSADLVIYFGNREALRDGARYGELRAAYPGAQLIGGSATASIQGDSLDQRMIVAAAVGFAHTRLKAAQWTGIANAQSQHCGEQIGRALAAPDLAGVFVLADGMNVNGSRLTAGIEHILGGACPIFGGMTSDPCDYTEALAGANAPPAPGVVAALGLYGETIRLALGQSCGWDAFGPRRRITRSAGNVLLELDDKPPLGLYERYLGEEIGAGTEAGVIFPLLISPPDRPEQTVVRAILHMDHASGAMTFAGDMPQGWMARLMRGNLDRLALAAAEAARQARARLAEPVLGDRLALMITCTGRFLLMGQRTVDEIGFARDELWPDIRCLGFYSYGEIAPSGGSGEAELHNQTMTIVALAETV